MTWGSGRGVWVVAKFFAAPSPAPTVQLLPQKTHSNGTRNSVSEFSDSIVVEILRRRPENWQSMMTWPELSGGLIPEGVKVDGGQFLPAPMKSRPPHRNNLRGKTASGKGEHVEVEIVRGIAARFYITSIELAAVGRHPLECSEPHLHAIWHFERFPEPMPDERSEKRLLVGTHVIRNDRALKRRNPWRRTGIKQHVDHIVSVGRPVSCPNWKMQADKVSNRRCFGKRTILAFRRSS